MLFLAGNTNKALCSAATLAVLDALYAIRTIRDLKRAMEEATEIWMANPQKKPCFRKKEYQGKTAFYHYQLAFQNVSEVRA